MNAATTADAIVASHPSGSGVPLTRAVAAVLAVLRDGPDGVEVLLIERALNEEDPASGHIGLPGGHAEPFDGTLEATAARECDEEVGVGIADLRTPPRFVVVGRALSSRMRVAVFCAAHRPDGAPPRARDPAEVADVFWAPARAFSQVELVERETARGPRLVPAVRVEGRVVWGFTLRVLRILFGYEAGAVQELE